MHHTSPAPTHRQRAASRYAWPLAVLVAALAVRGGVLSLGAGRLHADPDSYRQLALGVLDYGVYGYPEANGADSASPLRPTAYRPPLYPLLLAAIGGCDGVGAGSVALLHLMLGVGTVLLVYRVGRQWRWGRPAAAGAALLTACDPLLLYQSTVVMTETVAACLAIVGLAALTRLSRRPSAGAAVWAGAALALAALCRPTFLVWLAAVLLVVVGRTAFPGRRDSPEGPSYARRWAVAAGFTAGAVLVLAPWAGRNAAVFGRPILSTTHGGYTLWRANNDDYYRFLAEAPWGAVWDSQAIDQRFNAVQADVRGDAQAELLADRWARGQAWDTIGRRPGLFAYACLVRVGTFWGLVPHRLAADESRTRRLLRYAVGVWYTAVFVAAGCGVWRVRRRLGRQPWLWGVLLVLAFTAVHAWYWTDLRMRAPVMPVVCLLAAAGIAAPPGKGQGYPRWNGGGP